MSLSPRNSASFTLPAIPRRPEPPILSPHMDAGDTSKGSGQAAQQIGIRKRNRVAPEPTESDQQAPDSQGEVLEDAITESQTEECDRQDLTEVTVQPSSNPESPLPNELPKFRWSLGWAMCISGCFLIFPLFVAALIPTFSKKHREYNYIVPAGISRGILLYLVLVLGILIVYLSTCSNCGLGGFDLKVFVETTIWKGLIDFWQLVSGS